MTISREAALVACGAAVGFLSALVVQRLVAHTRSRRSASAAEQRTKDPPVVDNSDAWTARLCRPVNPGLYAFYSSATGAITTDPALMAIPIDDHAIVRGHCVFDTCSLCPAGHTYRLGVHLARLFKSAREARLPLPFEGGEAANAERMRVVIRAACRASGRAAADVRFWLTAGTGNLGVTPAGCTPQFYVLVFGGLPVPAEWESRGISEATVPEELVPMKPPLLAELKSNNYMLNALLMMKVERRILFVSGGGLVVFIRSFERQATCFGLL